MNPETKNKLSKLSVYVLTGSVIFAISWDVVAAGVSYSSWISRITLGVIVVFISAVLGWEAYLTETGADISVTSILRDLMARHPILIFACGLLTGHLFWYQTLVSPHDHTISHIVLQMATAHPILVFFLGGLVLRIVWPATINR